MYVSVVGLGQCDKKISDLAYRVGSLLGSHGVIVVCGGLGGVMDAVAHGAKAGGGLTVGLLPGETKAGAAPALDVALPTGLGHARNALVARAGDGIIAIGAGFGTLSEIALALKMGKPVVGLETWELRRMGKKVDDIIVAATPEAAVEKIISLIDENYSSRP